MPTLPSSPRASNIRDNHTRGNVGDFLRERIEPDSLLSFVTAYFTIYGYAALRNQLEQIERLRLLFGEPRFIREVDPDKSAGKQFLIDASGLRIANQLSQRAVARECADWIRNGVCEIRPHQHARRVCSPIEDRDQGSEIRSQTTEKLR